MSNTWLRSADEEKWAASVEFLMRSAKILVVDAREETESLNDEIQAIFVARLISNNIFVCDEKGHCKAFQPLLAEGSISRGTSVCVASAELVLSALPQLVIQRSTPSTHPVLATRWRIIGQSLPH
jgi:hypothetical protein